MYVNTWPEMTALPAGTVFLLKDGGPGQTYHRCDNDKIVALGEIDVEYRDSLIIENLQSGFVQSELDELSKAAARLLPALVLHQAGS